MLDLSIMRNPYDLHYRTCSMCANLCSKGFELAYSSSNNDGYNECDSMCQYAADSKDELEYNMQRAALALLAAGVNED